MSPVLITGGAQRLGLAMAEALLEQGNPVIITYRTEKPSVAALAAKGAEVLQCNFANNDAITDLINTVKQKHTALRAIIHNASDWDQESDNPDYAGLLAKMMQVHVSAPYQINLGLQDLLLKHESVADILHMTDYVQVKGSKKHIAYAASKAALHNLTLSFSALLAPQVKVNSIA